MDGWTILIAVLGLLATILIAALGAVGGAAWRSGRQTEKIATLEAKLAAVEQRQDSMRDRMARGDTAFAELRGMFTGMKSTLDEIKQDVEKLLSR